MKPVKTVIQDNLQQFAHSPLLLLHIHHLQYFPVLKYIMPQRPSLTLRHQAAK
jgi:hypothetical protein